MGPEAPQRTVASLIFVKMDVWMIVKQANYVEAVQYVLIIRLRSPGIACKTGAQRGHQMPERRCCVTILTAFAHAALRMMAFGIGR